MKDEEFEMLVNDIIIPALKGVNEIVVANQKKICEHERILKVNGFIQN